MKKIKLLLIIALTAVISIVSFNFTDGYFEHSKNIDIFTTLYGKLNVYYVDDTEPGKLMKTGIDAMLKSLDPYTVYYPESDIEDYRFMTTGQYGGIGSLITKKDSFVVISEPADPLRNASSAIPNNLAQVSALYLLRRAIARRCSCFGHIFGILYMYFFF